MEDAAMNTVNTINQNALTLGDNDAFVPTANIAASTKDVPVESADANDTGHTDYTRTAKDSGLDKPPTKSTTQSAPAASSKPEPAATAPQGKDIEGAPELWANQFEKLSRRDSDLRAREQALKAAEEKSKQIASEVEEVSRLKNLARSNPLQLLQELGTTPEQVMQWQLNQGRPDPHTELKNVREETAKTKEEVQKQIQDIRNQQIEFAERQFDQKLADKWEGEFEALIAGDEYKIVREWDGARQEVVNRVAQHYLQNKNTMGENRYLLPPKQELDKVKQELEKRLEAVKHHFIPAASAQAKDTTPASAPQKKPQGTKTITPKLGASVQRSLRPYDEEEEMARIAAKYS